MMDSNWDALRQELAEHGLLLPRKLYKIRGGNGPAFITANTGGLMNRLFPLLSLIAIAEKTDSPVYVDWVSNDHCAAELADLYDFEASGIVVVDIADIPISTTPKLICTYVGDEPIVPDNSGPLLIHSNGPMQTTDGAPLNLLAAFRLLVPVQHVRDRINAVALDADLSDKIGFHARVPFVSGAHDSLEKSKFPLPLEFYPSLLRKIFDGTTWVTGAFVCTNNPDLLRMLCDLSPNVLAANRTAFDNTNDARAIQDALVDLELLGRCGVVISAKASGWGYFAQHVMGSRFIALDTAAKPPTLNIQGSDLPIQGDSISLQRN